MEIAGKRSKARRGGRKPNPKSMIQGVVRARKCRHCGHHEIGVVTKSGKYLPLKPRMKIMLLQESQEE